jgi:hypothetical protein
MAVARATDGWSKVSATIPRIRMLLIPGRPAPKRNLGSKAFANVRKMVDWLWGVWAGPLPPITQQRP